MNPHREQFDKTAKQLYESLAQVIGVIDVPKKPFVARGHKDRLYSIWRFNGCEVTIYDSDGTFSIYFTCPEHQLRYEAYMRCYSEAWQQQLQNRFIYYMREYEAFKIKERAINKVKYESGFWYKLTQFFKR